MYVASLLSMQQIIVRMSYLGKDIKQELTRKESVDHMFSLMKEIEYRKEFQTKCQISQKSQVHRSCHFNLPVMASNTSVSG